MATTKLFELTPDQGADIVSATGVGGVVGTYLVGKTLEGITSYIMQGNLYVIVVTS